MLTSLPVATMLLLALVFPTAAQPASPVPDSKSALYQAKGEHDRTYTFPGTGETIAYHIYVPAKWDRSTRLPLVVVTHGANQPATAPFQRPMNDPTLAKTAELRGYLVAAVTGYHANATGVGGWNVPYSMIQVPNPGRGGGGRRGGDAPPPPTAEDFQRAEMDVLFVADLMTAEYNVDPNRVYLMGNSSGGSAVWNIGAKYPQRWTAISPSAAPLEDANFPYDKLKPVPVLVVHGDMDTTMVFDASKVMVDHAVARGVQAAWLPVVGGKHVDAWAQPEIISQIFDFFDAHKTKAR
jgi:poly(3-hydroxybutyrate) depolymerase